MDMENTSASRALIRMSLPVMLALLIQSVYNIVDSFFIAKYSIEGLTALSIVYPIQLLMTALATGTGAGVNLIISRMDGSGCNGRQPDVIRSGLLLAVFHWSLFAVCGIFLAPLYFHLSSQSELVCGQGIVYTRIALCGGLGLFVESICTKILQAKGNMTLPMEAQVLGAAVNVILDPVLIFGLLGAPELGIAGAATATVIGQWAAMLVTLAAALREFSLCGRAGISMCAEIYSNGIGSIATQSLYTLYIVGLNLILALFTEDAVTVLGIYYKIQSFFFIPLLGFQQVLLPVISYHFGAESHRRIGQTVKTAMLFSCALMLAAALIFMLFPRQLLSVFSSEPEILGIGAYALRVIALSFVPSGVTIVVSSHLQGISCMKESVCVIVLRQVILLVPLAWLLHFAGLEAVWWTFPITELTVAGIGMVIERRCVRRSVNITG